MSNVKLEFKTHKATIDQPRFTNDLKKGDWVRLANGWKAEIWDDVEGDRRVCGVHGADVVNTHDIVRWGKSPDNICFTVKHTDKQLKHSGSRQSLKEELK